MGHLDQAKIVQQMLTKPSRVVRFKFCASPRNQDNSEPCPTAYRFRDNNRHQKEQKIVYFKPENLIWLGEI